MARRSLTVLVAAPAVLAATEAAHDLAFRVVTPDAHELAHRLAETGHGWLAHAAPLAALLAFVAAAGALLRVLAAARGRRAARLALLPFAIAPPLAFAVQEAIERTSHGDTLGDLAGERVFWIGLALQVPVALLAWTAARLVARAADEIGTAVARITAPVARRAVALAASWTDVARAPRSPLALTAAGRAPPG